MAKLDSGTTTNSQRMLMDNPKSVILMSPLTLPWVRRIFPEKNKNKT